MRVLWIVNTSLYIDKEHDSGTRGGWMEGALKQIVDVVDMHIASPVTKDCEEEKIGNISYHYFKYDQFSKKKIKYDYTLEQDICKIIESCEPDIIHIWGTEYLHSAAAVNAAEKLEIIPRVIVNIQGLVSIYSQHYMAGIPQDYWGGNTIIDRFSERSLLAGQNNLKQRGEYEKEALKKVGNVIGRTDWDRSCVQQINPRVQYYFCNEILRGNFYTSDKWNVQKCRRHSLFITQPSNPIKGFHNVLIALGILKKKYPDVLLYATGSNFFDKGIMNRSVYKILSAFLTQYKWTPYERYLISLIQKYDLKDCIHFTGELSREEMQELFLKTNVFVSASSIENESNAISEAHMLGVPVVASYVGGVTNRIRHGHDGYLYPYNEPYMLAYYIDELFQKEEIAESFSVNGIETAKIINDIEINRQNLLQIYQEVLGETV